MGKVVKFPGSYKPENPPQVEIEAAQTRENFAWCEQLAEGLMYSCLKNLQTNGINVVDSDTVVQLSFLSEVIKSCVYAEKEINHPLQDLAERFVSLHMVKTPDGNDAIKGDFNIIELSEWMEASEERSELNILTEEDDETPKPPVAS